MRKLYLSCGKKYIPGFILVSVVPFYMDKKGVLINLKVGE